MHRTIQVNIYPGDEGWYVAEAVHLPVVTQGRTYDQTIANLREALALHLEDESPEESGVYPGAPVLITLEMEPLHA
jgi:predicted RNase H-like HicB family nuclease